MEQKKQLLIKVLTKLQPYWNLAEGILALVESQYCDEKMIDGIANLIAQSINKTKDEKQKAKFKKSMEVIKKIQQKEMKENDVEEAEELLHQI